MIRTGRVGQSLEVGWPLAGLAANAPATATPRKARRR